MTDTPPPAPLPMPPLPTSAPAPMPPLPVVPDPTATVSSGTILSPAGIVSTPTDLLSRVLTPTMQTWEGKIAVATVTGIQVALGIFGILCASGVMHPTANLAAEITGVGEAVAAWISTNLVKNRTALKAAAITSVGPAS